MQALPERRLENLKRLYGNVAAVPSFDAAAIGRALELKKTNAKKSKEGVKGAEGRSPRRQVASRLRHDVGKYIARTARNLEQREVSGPLLGLLIEDLFAIDGEHKASARFETLAAPLFAMGGDPQLEQCRELLRYIDENEENIRRGESAAVRNAAAAALEIERLLSELRGVMQGEIE